MPHRSRTSLTRRRSGRWGRAFFCLVLGLLFWRGASARAAPPSSQPGSPSSRPASRQAASRPADLPPVQVTAPGRELSEARWFTRHLMGWWARQDVASVLARDPSLQISSNARGEKTLTLRGFDPRQVAVTLEGIPLFLPYDGKTDLGKLPAAMLRGVVLDKGTANGAMGGTIRLEMLRPGRGPLFTVSAETLPGLIYQADLIHSFRLGPLLYVLGGGFLERQGFYLPRRFPPSSHEDGGVRQNSDRRRWHIAGKARLLLGTSNYLEGFLSYLDGKWGIPPNTSRVQPRYWRFPLWRNLLGSLRHQLRLGPWTLEEQLYAALYQNTLASFDDNSYSTQKTQAAFHSTYKDWRLGGKIRLQGDQQWTPWLSTTLRGHASGLYEAHQRLDRPAGQKESVSAEVDDARFQMAAEIEGFFWKTWVAGLRFGGIVEAGQIGVVALASPGFWLGFQAPGWKIRLSAERQGRLPTLKERYSSSMGFRQPNLSLRPEQSWNLRAEANWFSWRPLSLKIAFFDSELLDLIESVPIGGGQEQLQNVGTSRFLGLEARSELRLGSWLLFQAGYTYLFARRLENDPPWLSYRPEHRAVFALRLAPWTWLRFSTSLQIVGEQRFRNPDSLAWGRLGTYLVWDAALEVRPWRWLAVWVRAENILDALYYTRYGFPSPGRQIRLGLRLQTP